MATASQKLPPFPEGRPPIMPDGNWDPIVLEWLKRLETIIKILRTEV